MEIHETYEIDLEKQCEALLYLLQLPDTKDAEATKTDGILGQCSS